MTENVGRALSSAAPPATASAMRISGRASVASLMLTTMLCLREARMQASNSCSTRLSSGVSCADTRAEVAERLSQAVDDAGRVVHVLLDARPHRAVGLAHHRGAAVRGEVGVLAVDRQVELRRAAAERERARQRRQRLVHGARRDARHRRLAVDGGAVRLEHVEGALRVEHDAGLGEHVERGLVDALHLGRREDLAAAGAARRSVRRRAWSWSPSASCGVASCRTSFTTKGEVTARTSAS